MPKLRGHNLISHPNRKIQVYPKGLTTAIGKSLIDFKNYGEGTSFYGWAGIKGGWQFANYNACHAGLNDARGRRYSHVINGIMNHRTKERVALRFLEWLFNYSPYQEIFVTKSAKTAWKDGVYVAKTDVPANLLAGGLIAGRAITEYPNIGEIWNGLLEQGVHPDIAFMFGHKFYSTEKEFGLNDRSSHVAIDGRNLTDHHVLNFLQNNRVDINSYKKTGHYGSISTTWWKPRPDEKPISVIPKLKDMMGELVNGGKKKYNPFDRVNVALSVEPGLGFEAFGSFLKKGYKAYV